MPQSPANELVHSEETGAMEFVSGTRLMGILPREAASRNTTNPIELLTGDLPEGVTGS
jgi:hypothetical protein